MSREYHSAENQRILSKLVEREVICCMSYEMDKLLSVNTELNDEDLPSWEEVENIYNYVCPECGDVVSDLDEVAEEDSEGNTVFICNNCGNTTEDEWDEEPAEVFEWWMVSNFLARELKKRGEVILTWGNGKYWGRCTTGQAIMMDYIICKIAEDMEILVGQKYSWEEK